MGQCPVMPPSGFGQEDERSVMAVQTEGSLCSTRQDKQHSFLVPHRHDLPMRCILDASQVDEIILYQAELLSRQEEQNSRLLREQEGIENLYSMEDSESEEDYAMSTFAASAFTEGGQTEVTNCTVATRLASNLDRYSEAKKKLSKKKPLVLNTPARRRSDRAVKATNATNSFDSIPASDPAPKADGIGCYPFQSRIKFTNSPNEGGAQGYMKILKSKDVVASLLGPCVGQHLAKQAKFSKEEFYNVLKLKMKLNLGDFYRNHYLPMFPHIPSPAGMAHVTRASTCKKPVLTPGLRATSSDSSSSRTSDMGDIAFGSGIASSTVRLLVDDSDFMDLAITGSLGLVDRKSGQDSPVAGSPTQKSPEHYIVLINRRSGVPLAVCALKSYNGPPIVRIYATKQRVVGQLPAASTDNLGLDWTDSYPLFGWAEFSTEGEFPMPARYSLYMASGSDGRFEKEPSYRAAHQTTGSPEITMVGRTQTESEYKGCALFSVVADEENGDEPYLSLSIARGIDPALMICFAAIVDEAMEKTMRLHCDLSAQQEQRRSRSRKSTPLRMSWDRSFG